MLKKIMKVGMSGVITASLLLTPSVALGFKEVKADNLDDLIQETKDHLSALDDEETAAKDELEDVESDITLTVEKISDIKSEVKVLKAEIKEIEYDIQSNEEELAKIDLDIESLQETIAQRMRVSQRLNNGNTILEVISESENLVDLIRRIRVLNHLSQGDSDLMNELNDLMEKQQGILASLIEEQDELATKEVTLETESSKLESYQEKLEEQKAELAEQIQAIESEKLSVEEALVIAEQQKKALEQATIEEVKISSSSSNSSSSSSNSYSTSSGMFIYPLASGVVTCEYMCYTNHTGIDLSNSSSSAPILAAAAGTVVVSGWHNSYGNYVIITHNINGSTYTTLYAHMATTPNVSVGQTVSQGQQIGIMGSTGNSTGPHLHFEIYEGLYNYPYSVNPRKYVNFPTQGVWW